MSKPTHACFTCPNNLRFFGQEVAQNHANERHHEVREVGIDYRGRITTWGPALVCAPRSINLIKFYCTHPECGWGFFTALDALVHGRKYSGHQTIPVEVRDTQTAPVEAQNIRPIDPEFIPPILTEPMDLEFDPEMVNHPKHYNEHPSGVECIEIVRHMNFNLGSAVKYLWRCGLKDDEIQELEKAKWYIEDEINRRKAVIESEAAHAVGAPKPLCEGRCGLPGGCRHLSDCAAHNGDPAAFCTCGIG